LSLRALIFPTCKKKAKKVMSSSIHQEVTLSACTHLTPPKDLFKAFGFTPEKVKTSDDKQ